MKKIITAGVVLAMTMIAGAGVIVNPASASANYQQSSSPADNLINGSALSDSTLVETGDAVPATYPGSWYQLRRHVENASPCGRPAHRRRSGYLLPRLQLRPDRIPPMELQRVLVRRRKQPRHPDRNR